MSQRPTMSPRSLPPSWSDTLPGRGESRQDGCIYVRQPPSTSERCSWQAPLRFRAASSALGGAGDSPGPHTTTLGRSSAQGRYSTFVGVTPEDDASDKGCRYWGEGSSPSLGSEHTPRNTKARKNSKAVTNLEIDLLDAGISRGLRVRAPSTPIKLRSYVSLESLVCSRV